MAAIPSMPLFVGDYLKDTADLSLEEHGAYLKMLMLLWARKAEPLSDDDVRMARRLGCSKSRWTDRLRPVLEPFFNVDAAGWSHERLSKEWNYALNRSKVCANKGARGGHAKALKDKETRLAGATAQPKHRHSTQPHIRKKESIEADASMAPVPAPPADPVYPNPAHPHALPGQMALAIDDALPADDSPAMEAPELKVGEPDVGAPALAPASAGAVVVQFPAAPPVINPKAVIFGMCRDWLVRASGRSDSSVRGLLGRWIARHGEAAVLTVLESCSRTPPATGDYIPWIEKGLRYESERTERGRGGRKMEAGAAEFLAWSDKYFQEA